MVVIGGLRGFKHLSPTTGIPPNYPRAQMEERSRLLTKGGGSEGGGGGGGGGGGSPPGAPLVLTLDGPMDWVDSGDEGDAEDNDELP